MNAAKHRCDFRVVGNLSNLALAKVRTVTAWAQSEGGQTGGICPDAAEVGLVWSGSHQVGTFRSASGGTSQIQKFETNEEKTFCLKLFFMIDEFLKGVHAKIFGTKNKKKTAGSEQTG